MLQFRPIACGGSQRPWLCASERVGAWLTPSQCEQLELCRQAALFNHNELWHEALTINRTNLWHTVPKHNLFDHAMRCCQSDRLKPLTYSRYADEDLVGIQARAC